MAVKLIVDKHEQLDSKLNHGSCVSDNLPIRERVRDDNSLPIEKDSTTTAQATAMKRTASLISLTLKDLPHVFNENSIQASVGTNGSPSLMFKTSTQRRLQRFSRRHQQLTLPDNKSTLRAEKETKQSSTLNSSTMPPLMEVSLHTPTLHNLQTTADIGQILFEKTLLSIIDTLTIKTSNFRLFRKIRI